MSGSENQELEFVMVKPDGVQRGLVGTVIQRFEKMGLKIVAMKMLTVSEEQAAQHYAEHEGKPFYPGLVSYITSGPVVAMVVQGLKAVYRTREHILGKTKPWEAAPGTIRGDYALDIGRNLVHAADSVENAKRELAIYFNNEEIQNYTRIDEAWLYE